MVAASPSRSYVYLVEPNRDPALMGWQSALAARETQRANVVLIGPATVEGYPMGDFDRTTAQELARILRARFPTIGLGIDGGRGRVGIPSQGLTPAIPTPLRFTGGTFDPPTYSATPSHNFGAGHTSWHGTANGHHVNFEMKINESSFDLVYVAGPTGGVSAGYYSINGETPVTFSTYAGSTELRTLRVSGLLTKGDFATYDVATENFSSDVIIPTIEETFESPISVGPLIEVGTNGTGELAIAEFIFYGEDENCGIQVHGVGHAGYTSFNQAYKPTTVAGWRESIALLQPDVIVLEVGLNDAAANSASNFEDGLKAQIAAIRSVGGPIPTTPILISASYDASGGEVFVDEWGEYVAVMREIAFDDPLIAFSNAGDHMPATGDLVTFDLYYSNKIHSNVDGRAYAMQAHILADALSL